VQFDLRTGRVRAWPLAVPPEERRVLLRADQAQLSNSQVIGSCALPARLSKAGKTAGLKPLP